MLSLRLTIVMYRSFHAKQSDVSVDHLQYSHSFMDSHLQICLRITPNAAHSPTLRRQSLKCLQTALFSMFTLKGHFSGITKEIGGLHRNHTGHMRVHS